MKEFFDSLEPHERSMILQAVNVYGGHDHPVVTEMNMSFLNNLFYVAHCLGRLHKVVVGSELDKAVEFQDPNIVGFHKQHDVLLEKMAAFKEYVNSDPSYSVVADGEPNFYHLMKDGNWVARVQFNGELMPNQQEDLMAKLALKKA